MTDTLSPRERQRINNMLAFHGFGQLEEGEGLNSQLGMCVRDHAHFRSLLLTCEPEHRRDMYEALRANLDFTPKPLDVYLSEGAAAAEALQLPTLNDDGTLRPFHPAVIETKPEKTEDEKTAEAIQETVAEVFGQAHVEVTCGKCTFTEQFHGFNRGEARRKMRAAGWRYDVTERGAREVCPNCPL